MVNLLMLSPRSMRKTPKRGKCITSLRRSELIARVKFYVLSHNKLAKCSNSTNIMTKAAECYSLCILLQFGVNRQTMPLVFKSKVLDFARSILRYMQAGNYVGFFRITAAEAFNLQFCHIEPYINEVGCRHFLSSIIVATSLIHIRLHAYLQSS
ncbi:hypothetical protein H6P81_007691 [Aristolochia fimbriata]|uniref:Uncharacterized protein n=1 Tax=Aristolochia fimbriata TaxID=158543 RepID=A0AAV7F4S7_ARIFI|nr:hypothetical protein H6P81_007691 [Aristolochia fimbriata]